MVMEHLDLLLLETSGPEHRLILTNKLNMISQTTIGIYLNNL